MSASSTTNDSRNHDSRGLTGNLSSLFARRPLVVLLAALVVGACATPPEEPSEPEPATTDATVSFSAERFVADAFPVAIAVDVDGTLPEDATLEVTDAAGSVVAALRIESSIIRLPAEGLVAQSEYRVDAVIGSTTTDSASLFVDVELAAPVLRFPESNYITIDPRQTVRWEPVNGASEYLVESSDGGEAVGRTKTRDTSAPLPTIGDGYGDRSWSVRSLREDGLRSQPSQRRSLTVTKSPKLNLLPRQGGVLWTTDGYGTVRGIHGAARAELELSTVGEEPPPPIVGNPAISEERIVFPMRGLVTGAEYEYRVRARPEEGDWTDWSSPTRFSVDDLGLVFIPIVEEEPVEFTMGNDEGFDDEAPAHQVRLTTRLLLQDAPLTNAEAARILNTLIAEGTAEVSETEVSANGRTILRLGELAYGNQFGLVVADGRLEPESERESHPAVGVTWHGALLLANRVSQGFGLQAAYGIASAQWSRMTPSVRLPTEAEWALGARGQTETQFPWGADVSGNRANYYRSFDPFEDVNFPFTRSGGPTVPARYFDGSRRNGFQTLPNRSPAGLWDVVGNVWEWCWDWYDSESFSREDQESPVIDPIGPAEGDFRVVRGCAWNTRLPDVRVTNRGRFAPSESSFSIGVRLALEPPQP